MSRTRILFIAGLLGAAILVIVLITNRDTARLDVLYCGYTNQNQVVFSLFNGSPAPVTYWIGLAQVKTNGAWLRPHISPNDGVLPAPAVLGSAAETQVIVEAPSGDAEWRLPVIWQVQGKERTVGGIIKYNLRVLKLWWPRRHQVSRPQIVMRGDQTVRTAYSGTVPNGK